MLREHEAVCYDKDTMYTTRIAKMQQVIDTLTADLADSRQDVAERQAAKLASGEKAAVRHCKNFLLRGQGPSILNCVRLWRHYTEEKKEERKKDKMAAMWCKKGQLVHTFHAWVKATVAATKERLDSMHDAKLETVTREIITRYETELEKLRSQLKESHQEIARGHVQRQQLEEKMRRTFLKGMTAMNMEALHLFNQAAKNDASFSGAADVAQHEHKIQGQNSPYM